MSDNGRCCTPLLSKHTFQDAAYQVWGCETTEPYPLEHRAIKTQSAGAFLCCMSQVDQDALGSAHELLKIGNG
jgi:hypothetical protein